MKHRPTFNFFVVLGMLVGPLWGFAPQKVGGTSFNTVDPGPVVQIASTHRTGMPGWPIPDKPIPRHEPGQSFQSRNTTHLVTRLNPLGEQEVVELRGLDALLANGTLSDPLQGNYRLASLDKVMFSNYTYGSNDFSIQSFEFVTPTLNLIPSSSVSYGNIRFNAIAAGDLNGDFVDEQITAWVDPNNTHIMMSVGELPGSAGKATSAPAVVAHPDGSLDLVVRGYDQALWRSHYDGSSWGNWDNAAGGLLLSKPAVASRGTGLIDVFAVGFNNQVYHTQWISPTWNAWDLIDGGGIFQEIDWSVPLPEVPAPAVTARSGAQLDLFRLGPDHTLWWCHSTDGLTWSSWVALGGMLASEPDAVSLGDGRMQVYSLGMDGDLWYRTYNAGWGTWQRLETPAGVAGNAAPVLVSPATGQVEVYLAGTENRVWSNQHNGSSWSGWSSTMVEGGIKTSPGKVGWGLNLDGVDDYIEVAIDVSETIYSAAFWFKTRCEDCGIFQVDKLENYYYHDRDVYMNGGNVCTRIWSEETICTSGTNFADGSWHHLVHTFGSGIGGQKLYLDRVERASGVKASSDAVEQSGLKIGFSDRVRGYFNGLIDEVAVFTRTLTSTDIDQIYASGWDSQEGVQMGLHLEEANAVHGTIITDSSGNGHDGTLNTGESVAEIGLDAGVGAAIAPGGTYLFTQMDDGSLQFNLNSSGWARLEGLDISQRYDTGADTMPLPGDDAVENSVFDLTTGYFTGDGRQQVVLAYVDDTQNLRLEIYDVNDGFKPVKVAQLDPPGVPGGFPRIATGDVDGDGLDEIGLVYAADQETNPRMWCKLRLYQVERNPNDGSWTGNLSQIDESPLFTFDPVPSFAWTLQVAAGDIVPDDDNPNDEFVVITDWGDSNPIGGMIGSQLHIHDYDADSSWTLKFSKDIYALGGNHWDDEAATGLGLAIGNVDGFGLDEIIFTWPREFDLGDWPDLKRDLVIYGWDVGGDNFVQLGAYLIPGYSRWSFLDTLAVGDLDQDLKDEIIMASHRGNKFPTVNYYLDIYELESLGTGPIHSYPLSGYSTVPRAFNLALGDFTGESLRVGPPTYRVQNQMTTPVAFLNLPPMHRDIIEVGGVDQVIEVINDAQAVHIGESSGAEVYSSESKREWELSTGIEMSVGGGGHKVKTSMENTYGENFSESTTQINRIEITDETTANLFDQIIYNGTNYAVWEYPVYGSEADNPDEAQTISVVWPLVDQTNQPATIRGTWCDENFYTPNHQTYNVWSYDHINLGDAGFEDMGEKVLEKQTTGGSETTLRMSENSGATRSSSYHNQISAGLEYSYESELNIPLVGKAWDFSFRAYANGEYGHENLSTFSSEVTEATGVSISYPAHSSFPNIKAYLYWAEAGYLVVDYQTEPDAGAPPWSLYDKADPAFILPWYGFPDPSDPEPPTCTGKQLYTHDIAFNPAYVQNGDTVTMTATVRNFSAQSLSNVTIRFYIGEPSTDNDIGECSITDLNRNLGLKQCSDTWIVNDASGEVKVYAVIDPANAIDEMHDADDLINNNIGYGLLHVANADYYDPGLRETQVYQSIIYEEAPGLGFELYLPTENITETVRYELVPTTINGLTIIGRPIQVLAFQGGQQYPEHPHYFGDIPSGMMAVYRDIDLLPGMIENNLKLYRQQDATWVEATCPGHGLIRFPESNRIAVPICQTGTFILTEAQFLTDTEEIFLPLVVK
jgi:hypothetical protein